MPSSIAFSMQAATLAALLLAVPSAQARCATAQRPATISVAQLQQQQQQQQHRAAAFNLMVNQLLTPAVPATRHAYTHKRSSVDHSRASYDVVETADAYTLDLEFPGCSLKDVQVVLEEGNETLLIAAQRPRRGSKPEGPVLQQRIPLGREIDALHISAAMADGVLTVRLPKVPTKPAVQIAVQTELPQQSVPTTPEGHNDSTSLGAPEPETQAASEASAEAQQEQKSEDAPLPWTWEIKEETEEPQPQQSTENAAPTPAAVEATHRSIA